VKPKKESFINISLKLTDTPSETSKTIPCLNAESEKPEHDKKSTRENVEDVIQRISLRSGIITEYGAKGARPPVQYLDLEFQLRYEARLIKDSTSVEVVACCMNISEDSTIVCGSFIFMDRSNNPNLKNIERTFRSDKMRCEEQTLTPRDKFSDTLQFSLLTQDFPQSRRFVYLWCVFFHGSDNMPWEETQPVNLGIIRIPISGIGPLKLGPKESK
jgi:hypothetical protein